MTAGTKTLPGRILVIALSLAARADPTTSSVTREGVVLDGPAKDTRLFGRDVTIAIVANEFFEPKVTRMGGFGYSTRMVSDIFRKHAELGVNLIYVLASPYDRVDGKADTTGEVWVHGRPLINVKARTKLASGKHTTSSTWARTYLEAKHVDLLLFIDYRKTYLDAHEILPSVPIIVWARDPRTQRQRDAIRHIHVPGQKRRGGAQGTNPPDARSARALFDDFRGRVAVGMTWGPALRDRTYEAYNLPASTVVDELPNVIETCAGFGDAPKTDDVEAARPEVLFLARLDPYKRPWLLVELAKTHPDVDFYVAGKSHFTGDGSFVAPSPDDVPNLHFLGHVQSEAEKAERLSRAWFIVNLSVHEGVAISFLEALHCRTPVLATVNPGNLVSRFGLFAGEWSGDGLEGLPNVTAAFDRLIADKALRRSLGAAGRRHVVETHNLGRFLGQFKALAETVGISGPQT